MKNYIGRKCKGFSFEDGIDGVEWNPGMKHLIGKVGVIANQADNIVRIDFEEDWWNYPMSLIEPHLIPETPEIPQLGEGIEMEVSDNGIEWQHARPIQEVKKYTKEDLVKILGHDFEII
jgi:hypothetical protein